MRRSEILKPGLESIRIMRRSGNEVPDLGSIRIMRRSAEQPPIPDLDSIRYFIQTRRDSSPSIKIWHSTFDKKLRNTIPTGDLMCEFYQDNATFG